MKITGETKLVGILGDPVDHSLSPIMQNAAFSAAGLDICYVPLHVPPEDLAEAVQGLKAMRFLGANVTIPHKVATVPLADRLTDSAIMAGAINTLVNDDGALVGHNTDGAGFIRALEEKVTLDYEETRVMIAGAGGASRSVCASLAGKGVKQITVINRTRARAVDLVDVLSRSFPDLGFLVMTPEDDYDALIESSRLVINATSVGMDARLKTPPLRVDRLSKDHVVCDIVYTRSQETPLLVAAREKGAITLGGVGMLLHQGAVAFQLWTGIAAPLEAMRRVIES